MKASPLCFEDVGSTSDSKKRQAATSHFLEARGAYRDFLGLRYRATHTDQPRRIQPAACSSGHIGTPALVTQSPDLTGSIQLESQERPVLYRMRGISLLPDEEGRRLFAGPVRWYTDEPDFLWLNDRWGFLEGQIDTETGRFRTEVYVLHPEPPD